MKSALIYVGVAISALIAAFVAGRYSVPTKVEYRDEVITLTQVIHTKSIHRVTNTKWKRITESKPDGSTTVVETGDAQETETTSTNTQSEQNTKSYTTRETDAKRPQWQITAYAGATGLNPRLDLSGVSALISADVGRRLIGPVWAHIQVQSNATIMLGLGLEF